MEEDVHEFRGVPLLHPGGQLPLGTQHIMGYYPSSFPTFPSSPGPCNCSGVWEGAWHSPNVPREEGRFPGEKLERERIGVSPRPERRWFLGWDEGRAVDLQRVTY